MSLFAVNMAFLVGNVTQQPEFKYAQSGTPVLRFSVATNESVKQQDGSYNDVPTYHNIVMFGKIAEATAKNLAKGMKVAIEGKIDNQSYEKDGVKKYYSQVIARKTILMSQNGNTGGTAVVQQPAQVAQQPQVRQQQPVAQRPVQQPIQQPQPTYQPPVQNAQPQDFEAEMDQLNSMY